ncbi:MAG: hypothetical protein ACLGG0_12685 [Bacteriovoracia bacterium]
MTLSRLVCVFMMLFSFVVPSFAYDLQYKREAEIPEPLLFDLVRRVNSDKGELEFNSLFNHTDASEMKGVYTAPEVEYAFADGKAIEFELPTIDGKVKTFKTALQLELPNWWGDLTGTQIMHERVNGKSINETTLLLLSGKRLSEKWSIFTMVGNRFVYGNEETIQNAKWRELPIINLNFFYDYADVFDLGLETNLRGVGASFQEFVLMPQIHALMAKDFKLQMGFGSSYDGFSFSPITAFRLIKEFNNGH